MVLSAVEKHSLADRVFEQLAGEIVSGRYLPGHAIASERELSEIFAVNRHVVREALKRLQQLGLLNVAQGGRTTVLDFTRSAGLDLLAIVAQHTNGTDALAPVLAAALEMRAGIGSDLARLCAERAASRTRDELLELAERLAHASEDAEMLALDEQFWQRILDAAGNLAYQLAFNTLLRTVHTRQDQAVRWLWHELRRGDYRRPIAQAIAVGDQELAATAARAALTARELSALDGPARPAEGER